MARLLHGYLHSVTFEMLVKCENCGVVIDVSGKRTRGRLCGDCKKKRRNQRRLKYKSKEISYGKEYIKRHHVRDHKNARRRERYATDENYRARVKAQKIKKAYGLTPEIEESILQKQNHKCRACMRKFSHTVILVRDHCHIGGHFRGFLCNHCNVILGFAEATGNPESTLLNLLKIVQENILFEI